MLEILNSINRLKPTVADIAINRIMVPTGEALGYAGAGLVYNDVYYHHGGYHGGPRKNLLSYNPLTNSVTHLASSNISNYYHHGCAHNGELYFFGGWGGGGNTFEKYNIATNTWQTLNNTNFYSIQSKSQQVGDRVYFISTKPGVAGDIHNTVMYFDLNDLTFKELIHFPTMSFNRAGGFNGSSLVCLNGFIYIFNGNSAEIIKINIATLEYNAFTYMGPWRHTGIPYIFDNKIFYWSGAGINGYDEPAPSLFYIDPTNMEQYVVKPDLHYSPYQSRYYAAPAFNEDFVFTAGGFGEAATNSLIMINLKKLSKNIILA